MQNLGKTFILGETEKFSELGGVFCKIPVATSDRTLSDWIIKTLDDQVSRVVIEIGDRASDSLKIAYHIRLSVEELRDKALVSIVFISEHPLEVLIETLKEYDSEGYSQILFTEGVHFITADGGEISSDNRLMIEHLGRIAPKDYKTKFLSRISVKPTEKFGRHSLANAWGAYALLKAAGGNLVVEDNEFRSSLYFKYRTAQNFDERKFLSKLSPKGTIALTPPKVKNKAKGKAKKILLIDDEASKGWEQALRSIFSMSSPTNELTVISEQVSDYNSLSKESREIIETTDFDLFLVDLRLNGSDENMDQRPENFSGTKVIKKIKELNPGNQVISFTASNKVWNMKAVLDAGADGYYVKESPEYGFSRKFSKENFKQFQRDVEDSLVRSKYLKLVFAKLERLKFLSKSMGLSIDFNSTLASNLEIVFQLVRKSFEEEKYRNYAYLQLYLLIEEFAKEPTVFFQQGRDYYVAAYSKNFKVLTFNRYEGKKTIYNSELEWIDSSKHYKKGKKPYDRPIDTNFKVSALLLFRYGCSDSDEQNWNTMRDNRNKKAAHPEDGDIEQGEFIDLIDFIIFLFDTENVFVYRQPNLQNSLKALTNKFPGSK